MMAIMLKNSRAVSKAVLATIIVIVLAVCVTAGFIAYQLKPTTTSSSSSTPSPTAIPTPQSTSDQGGTAAEEKISVQGASITATTATVYVEQSSGPAATVNSLIVKDSSGNSLGVITTLTGTDNPLSNGVLTTITGSTGLELLLTLAQAIQLQ